MFPKCFNEHSLAVHGWGNFPCLENNCKYEAYSQMCLKQHLRTHKLETNAIKLSVRCNRENCGKRFSNNYKLEQHHQIHDNILTRCAFCQWGGVVKENFSIHMNTHFHNKPYACSKCPKAFYTTNIRKSHFEAFHEKQTDKYSCKICEFETYSSPQLGKHMIKKHPLGLK
jgi:hypothetical protein